MDHKAKLINHVSDFFGSGPFYGSMPTHNSIELIDLLANVWDEFRLQRERWIPGYDGFKTWCSQSGVIELFDGESSIHFHYMTSQNYKTYLTVVYSPIDAPIYVIQLEIDSRKLG